MRTKTNAKSDGVRALQFTLASDIIELLLYAGANCNGELLETESAIMYDKRNAESSVS